MPEIQRPWQSPLAAAVAAYVHCCVTALVEAGEARIRQFRAGLVGYRVAFCWAADAGHFTSLSSPVVLPPLLNARAARSQRHRIRYRRSRADEAYSKMPPAIFVAKVPLLAVGKQYLSVDKV